MTRDEFVLKALRRGQNAVGKILKIKLSSGTVREAIITRVEFDKLQNVSPCYQTAVFNVYQAIPKLNGDGTVERMVRVAVKDLPF